MMDTINLMKATRKPIQFQMFLLALFLVLSDSNKVIGQDKPEFDDNITRENIVGLNISDYTFSRVKNYKNQRAVEPFRLSELHGKWGILYFWTKSCVSCVNSFPKLDKIQSDYSADVQVVLIGIKDMWNKNIEPYFDGVKNAQKINLPVAYDTGLVRKLTIVSASTIVVVNPEGIVASVFLSDGDLKKKIRTITRRRKNRKGI